MYHPLTSLKMEQYSQYLMSMKRNNNILMNKFSSHSWEEQAFAEDARGPLGSFVWPPRSYSCSFCRREFRSAQALGGHMNVHRREKAKFKQSVTNLSRVSSTPALGQESLDSSSDMKSCVYDEGFVRVVETSLVLGFDLDSCLNTGTGTGSDGGGGKRRKRHYVEPPIIDGLDLELRLATFHAC